MLTERPFVRPYPKVPLERRVAAFVIDFVTVWFLSSFFGSLLQWLVFLFGWLVLRIFLVERNQGQSLGSWLLDMKVLDARFNKIPDLLSLAKREGIVGGGALLAMLGLQIGLTNGLSLLLLLAPLLVDCGIAWTDEDFHQAFHDRVAGTIVIQTKRGFSLDLRLKKVYAQLRRKIKNFR